MRIVRYDGICCGNNDVSVDHLSERQQLGARWTRPWDPEALGTSRSLHAPAPLGHGKGTARGATYRAIMVWQFTSLIEFAPLMTS